MHLRVLLLLWHLADRWGRVRPDDVYLDLPLTHDLIARMVGAHRTTVTLAIGRLREEGRLERTDRGAWLLLGGVPDGLTDVALPVQLHGSAGAPKDSRQALGGVG